MSNGPGRRHSELTRTWTRPSKVPATTEMLVGLPTNISTAATAAESVEILVATTPVTYQADTVRECCPQGHEQCRISPNGVPSARWEAGRFATVARASMGTTGSSNGRIQAMSLGESQWIRQHLQSLHPKTSAHRSCATDFRQLEVKTLRRDPAVAVMPLGPVLEQRRHPAMAPNRRPPAPRGEASVYEAQTKDYSRCAASFHVKHIRAG